MVKIHFFKIQIQFDSFVFKYKMRVLYFQDTIFWYLKFMYFDNIPYLKMVTLWYPNIHIHYKFLPIQPPNIQMYPLKSLEISKYPIFNIQISIKNARPLISILIQNSPTSNLQIPNIHDTRRAIKVYVHTSFNKIVLLLQRLPGIQTPLVSPLW